MFSHHGHRVLICIKGNCADPDLGKALEKEMNQFIQAHGLDDFNHPHYTTCRLTNCLGVCHSGPMIIVHPGAIRYHLVDAGKLTRICQEHLLHGKIVEELVLTYPQPKPALRTRKKA